MSDIADLLSSVRGEDPQEEEDNSIADLLKSVREGAAPAALGKPEDDIANLLASVRPKEKTTGWEDLKAAGSQIGGALQRTADEMDRVVSGVANKGLNLLGVEGDTFVPHSEQQTYAKQQQINKMFGHDEESFAKKEQGFGGKVITGGAVAATGAGLFLANPPAGIAFMSGLTYGSAENTKQQLIRQGVDESAANKVFWSQLVAEGVTNAIPLGGGVIKTGLKGAATVTGAATVNAGTGWLTDKLAQVALVDYPEVAAQFDPYNWENRGAEFLLGGGVAGGVSAIKTRQNTILEKKATKFLEGTKNDLEALKKEEAALKKRAKSAETAEKAPEQAQASLFPEGDTPTPTKPDAPLQAQPQEPPTKSFTEQPLQPGEKPADMYMDVDGIKKEQDWETERDNLNDLYDQVKAEYPEGSPQRTAVEQQMAEHSRSRPDPVKTPYDMWDIEFRKLQALHKQISEDYPEGSPQREAIEREMADHAKKMPEIPIPANEPVNVPKMKQLSLLDATSDPVAAAIAARVRKNKKANIEGQSKAEATEQALEKMREDFKKQQEKVAEDLMKSEARARQALPGQGLWGNFGTVRSAAEANLYTHTDIPSSVLRDKAASGIRGLAALTGNRFLQYANTVLNEAHAKTRQFIHDEFATWFKAIEKMSDLDKVIINRALQMGDEYQRKISNEIMQKNGYTEQQQRFINRYYEASGKMLARRNAVLRELGLPLIEAREGHLPSRWRGDYVQFVFDKDGNVVGVIQEQTIPAMWNAVQYMKKIDPTLTFSKRGAKEFAQVKATDLVSGIEMVTRLADTAGNPELKQKLAALKNASQLGGVEQSRNLYGFKKHEMYKKGVNGFLGKKAWKGEVDNAKDMFKAMAEYFEEGSASTEQMAIAGKMKALIHDLQTKYDKPKTAELLQQYMDTEAGRKENLLATLSGSALALLGQATGTGVSGPSKLMSKAQNVAQLTLLGTFNAKFALAQLYQLIQTGLPNFIALNRAVENGTVDLAKIAVTAAMKNLVLTAADGHLNGKLSKTIHKIFDPDEITALKYAQRHGLLQFSELENVKQFGDSVGVKKLRAAAEWTIKKSEQATRPAMYIASFNALRKAGYPMELAMETAHNVTQMAMIDYNQHQRAMIYKQSGAAGSAMGRLRTFTHGNLTNGVFLAKKSKADFMVAAITLGLFAGVAGMPGVSIVEDLWTDLTGKDMYASIPDNIENWVRFGAVSNATGLWMQPTFSMDNIIPSTQRGFLDNAAPYLAFLAKGGAKTIDAVTSNTSRKYGEAAASLAPTQLRGFITEKVRRRPDNYSNDSRGEKNIPMTDAEWTRHRWNMPSPEMGAFNAKRWKALSYNEKLAKEAQSIASSVTEKLIAREYVYKDLDADLRRYSEIMGPKVMSEMLSSIISKVESRNMTKEEKLIASESDKSLMDLLRLYEQKATVLHRNTLR